MKRKFDPVKGSRAPVVNPAPGNGPDTGSPGATPAPDEFHRAASGSYGGNQSEQGSVIDPGQTVESPLASSMRDPVLDHLRSEGLKTDAPKAALHDDYQTRAIGRANVGDHPSMQRQTRADGDGVPTIGTLPSKPGWNEAEPVRKPV
jgi:hypothetical protein